MSTTTTMTSPPRVTADNVSSVFPDVDTSLAREVLPSAAAASARDNDLAGYNEEQVRLMDEVCIVLDDDDKPIGSANKKTCRWTPCPVREGRGCGGADSRLPESASPAVVDNC